MRRLLPLLLLAGSLAYGQTVINVGTIVPTPSGNIDSRYTDGDDSNPMSWAAIPNFANKIEGNAFAVDVCSTYLTQPGSPNATITNVGAAFPTGWSLTGADNCTLDYDATGTGSAVVILRATRSADTADTNAFTVESVTDETPPGTTDTTSPTQILGVVVTLDGSDQPVIAFDPPADVRVSAEDVSGLSTFTITRNATPLTPTAFTGTDFVPVYTTDDVGTVAASSATQTAEDWQQQGQGGHPNTATDFVFTHAPISGDFICTVKVVSFTGGTDAARGANLMMREDATAGSRQLNNHIFPTFNSRAYVRSVTAGAVVQQGLVTTTGFPTWLRIERSGTTLTAHSSEDGNDFGEVWTEVLGLNPTLEAGIGTSSNEAVTITIEYENLGCNTLPRQSFTDTGGSPEDSYTIIATDGEGNTSTASVAVVAPALPGGGSSETLDYDDPMAGVTILGGRTVTPVANSAGLTTELADQDCGETLSLADGVYTGDRAITANCPATNPFIVECANDHLCTATGRWTLTGAKNIIRLIKFDTGGRLRCDGNNNKIIGNEITGWTANDAVTAAKNATLCEIAYNELHNPLAPVTHRRGIRTTDDGANDFHYNGWIHHNYFHDLPDKPDPNNYSSGQTDAIEICETAGPAYADLDAGWYVEDNFMTDHAQMSGTAGGASIDMKCGGVVVRRNTITNSPGRLDQRAADVPSIFEANYLEDSGGMTFHGRGHTIAGNVILGGKDISLIAGNSTGVHCDESGNTQGGQASTCDALVTGNTAPIRIGRTYGAVTCGGNPTWKVTGTTIENHTGGVTFDCYDAGTTTDNRGGASTYTYEDAVKLTATDVGPDAIINASAAYKSARGL